MQLGHQGRNYTLVMLFFPYTYYCTTRLCTRSHDTFCRFVVKILSAFKIECTHIVLPGGTALSGEAE